jgi:hypothetical protein
MASFNFTVTQVTQNFTATVKYPLNLTLSESPDTVNVVTALTTVTVINNIQPVTVSGIGGGSGVNPFNQSLNTGDNVTFDTLTVSEIYGPAQTPVYFPNGINVQNFGNTFNGSIDLGGVYNTFTNQISLLLALIPLNFGSALNPATYTIKF